jgi:hypothetical protein
MDSRKPIHLSKPLVRKAKKTETVELRAVMTNRTPRRRKFRKSQRERGKQLRRGGAKDDSVGMDI